MEDTVEVISEKSSFAEKKYWTLRYKWTLKDFKNCTGVTKSCPLSSGLEEIQDVWFIEFDHDRSYRYKMNLRLEKLTGMKSLSASVKYSILSPDSVKRFVSLETVLTKFEEGSQQNFNDVCNGIQPGPVLQNSSDFFPNGHLTILYEIQISSDFFLKKLSFSSNIHKCQLAKDLAMAFENEKFGDVTFKVGERLFKAIKGILAVRSPVFCKMFEHKTMDENKNNEVIISDISEIVFKELLLFIYTGSTPIIEDMPVELLVAAEKYQLEELKNRCEEVLIRNISSENVIGFFSIAHTNNAMILKHHSAAFIKHNLQAVSKTEEYLTAKASQSILLAEVLDGIAQFS